MSDDFRTDRRTLLLAMAAVLAPFPALADDPPADGKKKKKKKEKQRLVDRPLAVLTDSFNDIEKKLKKAVKDPERRKAGLKVVKSYVELRDKFANTRAQFIRDLKDSAPDATTVEELEPALADIAKGTRALLEELVGLVDQLKAHVTEPEWAVLFGGKA